LVDYDLAITKSEAEDGHKLDIHPSTPEMNGISKEDTSSSQCIAAEENN